MPKALVIDDHASLTTMVGLFLSDAGFSVKAAVSGPEGLDKAMAEPPDVVILDIMMPGMDGYQVCRRLRSDPRTARAVIVALTARGQPVDVDMALRSGADLHMTKPFKGSVLLEEIERLLAERRPMISPQGFQILVLELEEAVGATTLACNLALCLAAEGKHLIALADMAVASGQTADCLGLGAPDVWPTAPLEDTGGMVASLVRHSSGLFALPSPSKGNRPTPDQVNELLQVLREWHDYVIVDTELNLGPLAPTLLSSSTLILLLLTPEPKVLKTAQTSLAAIRRLGSPTLQIWPILCKAQSDQITTRERAEKALKLPLKMVVPWSPEEFEAAKAGGKPLVLGDPQSPLAAAIQTLAAQIVEATNMRPAQEAAR
jgi:CheY-like chemotaxis protein/MinD-like ATPase involved in chromosome partitioning or flagellar assembly